MAVAVGDGVAVRLAVAEGVAETAEIVVLLVGPDVAAAGTVGSAVRVGVELEVGPGIGLVTVGERAATPVWVGLAAHPIRSVRISRRQEAASSR